MLQIGAEFPDPFSQHILMQIQMAGGLRHRNASILHQPHCFKLNSRLNFLLRIPTLQFRQTPYLGVHEIGSRPRSQINVSASLRASRGPRLHCRGRP